MTEAEFWKSWLAFWLMAGPILLCLGSLAFSFYLSRRHLDAMLDALKNSRYVLAASLGLLSQGWFGRLLLVSKITGMVIWPGPGIRAGEMDPNEIKNFPIYLRRLLMLTIATSAAIFIWGGLAFVLLKLS